MKIYLPRERDWYKWFAWYPVRIGNHIVWLQYIEKKKKFCRMLQFSVNEYRFQGG